MTLSALFSTLLSLRKSLRALTIFRRFLRKFRTKYPLHNQSNPTFTWCLLSPLCSHWLRVGVNSPVHPLIGKHSARNNPRGPNPSTTSLLWPGYLILTLPHQERYLSLQFRSSRTLVHDLELWSMISNTVLESPRPRSRSLPDQDQSFLRLQRCARDWRTRWLSNPLCFPFSYVPTCLTLGICPHLSLCYS